MIPSTSSPNQSKNIYISKSENTIVQKRIAVQYQQESYSHILEDVKCAFDPACPEGAVVSSGATPREH